MIKELEERIAQAEEEAARLQDEEAEEEDGGEDEEEEEEEEEEQAENKAFCLTQEMPITRYVPQGSRQILSRFTQGSPKHISIRKFAHRAWG